MALCRRPRAFNRKPGISASQSVHPVEYPIWCFTSCLWVVALILLAGDVERNPGPDPISSSPNEVPSRSNGDHGYCLDGKRNKWRSRFKKSYGCECAAYGCNNYTGTHPELLWSSFPKDQDRFLKWKINIRRMDIMHKSQAEMKHHKLCSAHFEKSQWMNPNDVKRGLLPNAVPTLIDAPNRPKLMSCARRPLVRELPSTKEPCQTDNDSSMQHPAPDSNNIESLKKKLAKYKTRLSRQKRKNTKSSTNDKLEKQSVIQNLKKYLSNLGWIFVASLIRTSGQKKGGARWSEQMISMCLQVRNASPKAYRILRKIFKLPSVRTLNKTLNRIKIKPGFHAAVFQALQDHAAHMKDLDKAVVIPFDEMGISKNLTYNVETDSLEGLENLGSPSSSEKVATHASVFMARGVTQKWKQPIGYFLSSGTMAAEILAEKITEAVRKVTETGLVPLAVIMDQGANNQKALRLLGVTTDEPYFMVDGHKIYGYYDPPHLLKCIRNNLKNRGFLVGSKIAKWKHVVDLFKHDSQKPIKMIPKLSEKHIDCSNFKLMSVPLAAQVMSHSVAAAMWTLADTKVLEVEAKVTADFIERFNRLFDTFNSSTLTSATPMKGALQDSHIPFLKETLEWLKTVKPAKGATLPCLEGWKQNITALIMIWEDMKARKAKFLMTRRMNQDCLEHFFGGIRGKGGFRDNPDTKNFRLSYRQAAIDCISVIGSNTNCEADDTFMLLNLSSLIEVAALERQDKPTAARKLDFYSHAEQRTPVRIKVTMVSSQTPGTPVKMARITGVSPISPEVGKNVFSPPIMPTRVSVVTGPGTASTGDSNCDGSTPPATPMKVCSSFPFTPPTNTPTGGGWNSILPTLPATPVKGNTTTAHLSAALPSPAVTPVMANAQPAIEGEVASPRSASLTIITKGTSPSASANSDPSLMRPPCTYVMPNGLRASLAKLLALLCPTRALDLSEENILIYLAGYLGHRAKQRHKCEDCIKLWSATKEEISELSEQYQFFNHKQYQEMTLSEKGLLAPSKVLVDVTRGMERTFRRVFPRLIHSQSIMSSLIRAFEDSVPDSQSLICGAQCDAGRIFMLKLFANLRIHHALKEQNRDLKKGRVGGKNRKLSKLCHI